MPLDCVHVHGNLHPPILLSVWFFWSLATFEVSSITTRKYNESTLPGRIRGEQGVSYHEPNSGTCCR